MNKDKKQTVEGPGPKANVPTGTKSDAKSLPDRQKSLEAANMLLSKLITKLEMKVESQAKELENKETQIVNLRKEGGVRKMHLTQH